VRGLDAWFVAVDCLVCMGGYNTIAEALSRGTPTVCVPRVVPRTEQLIRAEAFSRLGLMRYVHPDRLTGDSLREEVRVALGDSRADLQARAQASLGFDGAERAAAFLLELAAPDEKRSPAVSMR
jgi:predicted glycosyltransferase